MSLIEHRPPATPGRKQDKMSNEKRNKSLIPAIGFRILTCHISEEDDSAVFADSPLIGWLQTNDPTLDPVDPIFQDEAFSGTVLGSEMAGYNVAYRVFHSEKHEGQRFRIKQELEKEARFMEAKSLEREKKGKAA
jgi:hypothetical protein